MGFTLKQVHMISSQKNHLFSQFLILLCVTAFTTFALAYEGSEELRLSGFYDHIEGNRKFDRKRLSDVKEINQERVAWELARQKAVREFQIERAKRNTDLKDSSQAYAEDMKEKKAFDLALEKARQQYIQVRDLQRSRARKKYAVTEEQEYGLDQPVIRADKKVKKALGAGGSSSSIGSSAPAYTPPPSDFGSAIEFEPPPPPPVMGEAPEFFESDAPAVPELDTFDEPIPPPIFEDPEF